MNVPLRREMEHAADCGAMPIAALPMVGASRRVEQLVMQARFDIGQNVVALAQLRQTVDENFARAVELILAAGGRVVVFGLGKSGHIGRKIAATLSSTGTPSFFVHATEAFHGDLGMLSRGDVAVLISYSGETEEVARLLPHLRRLGVPAIALVGNTQSSLARGSDVVLSIRVPREVCPHNLAPTTSTVATLVMGDALAMALMRARQFGPGDFARYHPGGSLGRRLLTTVADVMRRHDLPTVRSETSLLETIITITKARLGLAAVTAHDDSVIGIITDGDLRRALVACGGRIEGRTAGDIMTRDPVCIEESAMFAAAEALMIERRINGLLVLDKTQRLVGIVQIYGADMSNPPKRTD